jgi:hypothetical protein
MPHFRCAACKTLLYSAASPPYLVGDLCAGCASPVEPSGELDAIAGSRSTKRRESVAAGEGSGAHERLVDRVGRLVGRLEVIRARDQLDAGRWDDDGGGSRAGAVTPTRPEHMTSAKTLEGAGS